MLRKLILILLVYAATFNRVADAGDLSFGVGSGSSGGSGGGISIGFSNLLSIGSGIASAIGANSEDFKIDSLNKEYKVDIYTNENKSAVTFVNPEVAAIEEPIAVLSAHEDIGVSAYDTYHGKRYIIVPKGEAQISPYNMLAYGLFLYAKEAGDNWCGPCKMAAPRSYAESKKFLKDQFHLTGTAAQNAAILQISNENLERLGEQGVKLDKAIYADIKAMAESLISLSVNGSFPDLSQLKDCKNCTKTKGKIEKELIASMTAAPRDGAVPYHHSSIDENNAALIAYDIRKKDNNSTSYEQAFTKLVCKDNEDMQIYMYGIPDNFNTTNIENTNPRPALVSSLSSSSQFQYGYDYSSDIRNPNVFAETLSGLPTNLTQGVFVIGLKEKGFRLGSNLTFYTDVYRIGADYTQNPNIDGNVSALRATWNHLPSDIYYQDLSLLTNNAGQTLLSTLQSGQSSLDAVFMYTTNIDFIAVAACITKSVVVTPIQDIPSSLQCSADKGEQYFEIWGGIPDNFAPGTDTATPSTVLQGIPNLIPYDKPIVKVGNFADTFAHPGSHISQLEVMINTRASTAGAGDDNIFVGQIPSLTSFNATINDPNDILTGINTPNGGMAHFIRGTDTVYANGTPSGDLLTLLNSNTNGIDILVANQTEVDTVRVAMCLQKDYVEQCTDTDGDGACDDVDCAPEDPTISVGCDVIDPTYPSSCQEDISINLSQATSWEYNGGNPTVNRANAVWDENMTWFDFGSAEGATHKLNIDFCACGNTEVIVDELKSDDKSKIYLDTDATPSSYVNSGGYIVSRPLANLGNMASSGPNESGSQTIVYSGSGVNHTLHFDVKNHYRVSGGAVNGTLNFKGHRGICTPADVVSGGGTPPPNRPDINLTVVDGGTFSVIDHVIFEPVEPGPVGPVVGGTFVLNVKSPAIRKNPKGTPVIVSNPRPIKIKVNKNNSKPSKPLPTGMNGQIGCDNGLVRVAWLDEDGFHSHTSSIGCSGDWIYSF